MNLEKKNSSLLASWSKLALLFLFVESVVRIISIFSPAIQASFSFSDFFKIFLFGGINDLCLFIVLSSFLIVNELLTTDRKYKCPFGYIIWGLYFVGFFYVIFFNNVFDEYGSVVPKIIKIFLFYKILSFGLRLFLPGFRKRWKETVRFVLIFIYVSGIFFNSIGEVLFWNEFGVRYNFIAVDYLIYTNEVIGNIEESYPLFPIFSVMFVLGIFSSYLIVKRISNNGKILFPILPWKRKKYLEYIAYSVLVVFSCFLLKINTSFQNTQDVYVNELQSDGLYKLYDAFRANDLNYDKFYPTMPAEKAISIINHQYKSKGKYNCQVIKDSLSELHKNIVLITVESLSGSYLTYYGNKENLTPNLDKLVNKSLSLDNLFAAGNRTVRGLEAVTLCLPPSAGESIIKQKNNKNLFSTGKILRDKGYIVQFFYGGNSYFDNMGEFFSGNGYKVIDRRAFSKQEISFENIWGVCDEDMFGKALKTFDEDNKSGRPFFGHIMTVSNHRPFTYPPGKIDIPVNIKSRQGGVKYTDYAIGKFLREASVKPWFKNTIFIITADHCASSAGKLRIPLENYHIPCLIYSPGFVKPEHNTKLASQIDIMPTVFGLLHFSYHSYFYGKDLYSKDYHPRAFAATYQDLGYYENGLLTVIYPMKRIDQYGVSEDKTWNFKAGRLKKPDFRYVDKTIANYQSSADFRLMMRSIPD